MICPRCGHEYDDTHEKCPVCGLPRSQETQSGSAVSLRKDTQGGRQGEAGYLYETAPPAGDAKGATPSTVLALGILSIFIGVVGIVLGILAVVFGTKARQTYPLGDARQTMANAGWTLGIIGTILQCFGLLISLSMTSYLNQLMAIMGTYA